MEIPSEPFQIPKRSIDDARPLKVIVIGAGISGIIATIILPRQVQNLDLAVYDKNEEVGGTWFENRYPGIACDIPAHSYQLSFESNPAWSSFYAAGPEILAYWKSVVAKYDSRKYMRLGHRATEARWSEDEAKWHVKFEKGQTGEVVEDSADVLITGMGFLNQWNWPDIKGLHDFEGKLMHSASYDANFDPRGKNVAVIGAGSSGIQIVPSLQPQVARLDHYVRGRTWIASTFAQDEVKESNHGEDGNFKFSPERIQAWLKDPQSYIEYRRHVEAGIQGTFEVTEKGSQAQKDVRAEFEQLMRNRLKLKPEIAQHLIPNFPPLCKRLTPGPGYLEALTMPNVDCMFDGISHVDATGVVSKDGTHRAVDAIVCATGFDTSFRNRFSIFGRHGVKLGDKWADFPTSYLTLGVDDFPNFFMSLGPNSGLGNGNLLMLIERLIAYFAQCLRKIQTEDIRTMEPTKSKVDAFENFCEAYFERTVYSESCSSWYKSKPLPGAPVQKSKVIALWPGSSLHAIRALEKPRWEDFTYTYINDNNFAWFGDGWAIPDRTRVSEQQTYYLESVAGRFVQNPLEAAEKVDGAPDTLIEINDPDKINDLNDVNNSNLNFVNPSAKPDISSTNDAEHSSQTKGGQGSEQSDIGEQSQSHQSHTEDPAVDVTDASSSEKEMERVDSAIAGVVTGGGL